MKYIVVLILVSAAYIAGYLTPKEAMSNIATEAASAVNSQPLIRHNELPMQMLNSTEASQVAVPKTELKAEADVATNSSSSTGTAPALKTQPIPAPAAADQSSGSTGQRPLTDEQIDKLVPPPFNKFLKGHDAALLEKYRKFSAQENPSSQDGDILNKISDAIASNPYSKFLNIESFQCKANLCEIRLYESKRGVWSYIQAEMSLQDWWKFHSSHATGFPSEKENINGWYVLLMME